jgi:hypothetical protein
MSKLMRGLVLGAMLAVLSSATAVAAPPPDGHDEAVQQFRDGERASADQPVVVADAVQQFRAGERAASGQLTLSDKANQQTLAAQRYWYYRSTRPEPTATPASPAQPDGRDDTPVVLIVALAAAAVLSLGLDAMFVRRKARKAKAHPAV